MTAAMEQAHTATDRELVATATVPATGDLFADARVLAAMLESASARCHAAKDREEKSELLAAARILGPAALALAAALGSWARDQKRAHARRLEGLAVGLEGPDGATWYVSTAWNWGSLVRCKDPEFAALWPDEEAVRGWLASLGRSKGKDAKGDPWPPPITMLAGRRLTLHRVRAVVEPVGRAFDVPAVGLATNRPTPAED